MNHNYSLRVQLKCEDLLLTHSISGTCITVKMLYYEETQLEVWASALQEVMKNIMGTNRFLLSLSLKEHQHTKMEELGNNDQLLPIFCFIYAKGWALRNNACTINLVLLVKKKMYIALNF